MKQDSEVTLRAIMILCSECNEPLTIIPQTEDPWRNVIRVKPCPVCMLAAYRKGYEAGEIAE